MSNANGSKPRVAYLGPPASYSHQAAIAWFDDQKCEFDPQSSIKDAFASVQSSSSTFAVVPFENSTFGTVVFTLDLLVDRESNFADLLVCGELYLSVCHCLVGHPPQRTSRTTSDDYVSADDSQLPVKGSQPVGKIKNFQHISTVYSHPQALGQCEKFLAQHLPKAEKQDVSSTSKAAERVAAEGPTCQSAAISSSLAAEMNGLEVLAKGIQDRDDNATRFFILKNRGSEKSSDDPPFQPPSDNGTKWKTLISFTLPQQPSGTLADVLQTFKDRELNLTGIHSRPSLEHAWHYVFLIEVQGMKEATGGGIMNEALNELERKTKGWRWLGSWIDRADQ